jgi:hypothetical protein
LAPAKDLKDYVMVALISDLFWPACSLALCVFGFFVGRCARKIPILDDHLPRALYRGQTPRVGAPPASEQAADNTHRTADS